MPQDGTVPFQCKGTFRQQFAFHNLAGRAAAMLPFSQWMMPLDF